MGLRWTNYRFKILNVVGLVTAFVLICVYQILVIFGYETDQKFFPYSAFFLNFNSIALSALVFIQKYSDYQDLYSILIKYFPKSGSELND
jgi:hypothetical protein